MNEVDKRVVQMEFDNAKFEKNIDQTMKTLEDLNKALQMRDASKGFNTLVDDSSRVEKSMSGIGAAVDEVKFKLTTMQVVGYTVLSELTKTAINVGKQMASAVWSPIVAGGARRSQNIEAAKFQLEGLGVAWKDISEDINYGVKSTAYGLDSAARVASQLVASNILPGDLMRNTLRGISGVAAMTNSSYDEIGSIFTTVAGNGKLMTMQLRQLSYRGMNAAATLAKYLKEVKGQADVTEQAIYDMVSKGKIDFETFASAMDWAFGEHAKEANKTFTGAMSNVNAALARIGAKFADPVYDNLRQVFTDLIPVIDSVNKIIDPVVDGFTNLLTLLRISVGSLLTEDFAKAIGMLFLDLYSYIRPLIGALVKVGALGRDLNGVGTGMLGVLSKLQLYGPAAEKVEHFFIGLFGILKLIFNIFKGFVTIVRPIFEAFIFGLGKIFGISGDIGQVMWGVSNILSVLVGKLSKFIALKIERTLKLIYSALSRIDLNKVKNGVIIVINVVEILTKAIILLGAVAFALIARAVTGIPKIVSSLGGVFERIGSIYDAFSGKLSNIFGGGKKTANFEVNTEVNGPDASEMVEDRIKTWEDVMTFDNMAEKNLDDYEKHVNRASQAMKEFGNASKKTGDDVKKNAASTRKAAKDMADSAKEATEYVQNLFKPKKNIGDQDRANYYKQQGERNFDPEAEAEKSPIVRFFTAIGNFVIFAAKKTVSAILTAFSWVASAVNAVFPAIGKFINTVFYKLSDFVENLNWFNALGYALEAVIISTLLIPFKLLWSVLGLIDAAALSLAASGISKILDSLTDNLFAIMVFLISLAAIAENVDLGKLDRVIDMLTYMTKAVVESLAILMLIINLAPIISSISSVFSLWKGGEAVKVIASGASAASMIFAISAFFGIILAAAVFATKYLSDPATFNKAMTNLGQILLTAGISLFVMVGLMILCLKALGTSGAITKSVTEQYGGIRGLFGRGNATLTKTAESNNPLGAIVNLILGLTAYIGVVMLALKMASKMSTGELTRGGLVIAAALGLLTATVAIISLSLRSFDRSWQKNSYTFGELGKGGFARENKGSGSRSTKSGSGDQLAAIANVIGSITKYLLTVTLAIKLASKLSPEEFERGGLTLAAALGALVVVIGILSIFAMEKTHSFQTDYITDSARSKMEGIAGVIKSMTWYLLAIVFALKATSTMKPEELHDGVLALGAMMLILSAVVVVLSAASKNAKPDVLKGLFKNVIALLATVALFLAAISYMPIGNIPTKAFVITGTTLAIVAVFMWGLMKSVRKILTTEKAVTRFTETMKHLIPSIIAIFATVGIFLAAMTAIKWKKLNGKAIALMYTMLAAVAGLAVVLMIFSKQTKTKSINTKAILAVLGGISLVLLAMASSLLIIGLADLKKISSNMAPVISLMAFSAILIAGVMLLAALVPGMQAATPAIISAFAGMSGLLLALAATMFILGKSDLEKINDNATLVIGILGVVVVIFGALVAIGAVIDAFSVGMGGKALLLAGAAVMVALGAFLLATAGAFKIASTIDAKQMTGALVGIADGLDYFFKKMSFIEYIELGFLGPELILLGMGLAAISIVDPNKIAKVGDAIKAMVDGLTDSLDGATMALIAIGIVGAIIAAPIFGSFLLVVGIVLVLIDLLKNLWDLCQWSWKIVVKFVVEGWEKLQQAWKWVEDKITNGIETSSDAIVYGGATALGWFNENVLGIEQDDPDDYVYTNRDGTIHRDDLIEAGYDPFSDFRENSSATEDQLERIDQTLESIQNHTNAIEADGEQAYSVIESLLDNEDMYNQWLEHRDQNGLPGVASIGDAMYVKPLANVLNYIKGSLSTNAANIRSAGVTMGTSLIDGIVSSIISKKEATKKAVSSLVDTAKEIDSQTSKASNLSRIFAEYGDSISKNITDKNREAIETTKELSNAMNNSANSMKELSKQSASSASSSVNQLSKEVMNLQKETSNVDLNEKMATQGREAGKSMKNGIMDNPLDDLLDWVGDGMETAINFAVEAGKDILPEGATDFLSAAESFLTDPFGSMGSFIGGISGMNASDVFTQLFIGNSLRTLQNQLSASQQATAQAARDAANLGRLYGTDSAQYQAAVTNYNTQQGVTQGLIEQIETWKNSSIYEKLGLPDLSDIWDPSSVGGLGGAGDYTNTAASDIASSSGAGSGINDSSIGGGGNTNINSNNTYNFTQNNYSPEALSRSDLYMQTRAQINAWYGWMRSQPAT